MLAHLYELAQGQASCPTLSADPRTRLYPSGGHAEGLTLVGVNVAALYSDASPAWKNCPNIQAIFAPIERAWNVNPNIVRVWHTSGE